MNIETGGAGLDVPYASFQRWRDSGEVDDATWFESPTLSSPPCVTSGYTGNLAGRFWTLNL